MPLIARAPQHSSALVGHNPPLKFSTASAETFRVDFLRFPPLRWLAWHLADRGILRMQIEEAFKRRLRQ
jgi:hypothetical protein